MIPWCISAGMATFDEAGAHTPGALPHAGKILVVDDEKLVRQSLSDILVAAGFGVLKAEDADEAVLVAKQSSPSLILSDVALKGMDGITLCRHLKSDPQTSSIPIILISGALIDNQDQILGLHSGADDYMVKPLDGELLIAKIRSVLHRYIPPLGGADCLKVKDLVVDIGAWTVTVAGHPVSLTRKEFDLLLMFLRRRGKVLHPSFLLESVWGHSKDIDDFRTVRVHISSLRSKLGAFGEHIVNIPGVGYKLEA